MFLSLCCLFVCVVGWYVLHCCASQSANTKALEGEFPSPFFGQGFHWVCLIGLWTRVHSLTNSPKFLTNLLLSYLLTSS